MCLQNSALAAGSARGEGQGLGAHAGQAGVSLEALSEADSPQRPTRERCYWEHAVGFNPTLFATALSLGCHWPPKRQRLGILLWLRPLSAT